MTEKLQNDNFLL